MHDNCGTKEKECPIPSTHVRLNDAHHLWHQAESDYFEPNAFRISLNSCIQALRNVTFVLQKEKRKIPGFDDWYACWQEKMRRDRILKWLTSARNIIVKQGDLETLSVARVSLLSSYYAEPRFDVEIEPNLIEKDIIDFVLNKDLPDFIRKNGFLKVERRWVSKDLRQFELLEALAHGYSVLNKLIDDAHIHCGLEVPIIIKACRDKPGKFIEVPRENFDGRLPCMVATEWNRTKIIRLSDHKEILVTDQTPVEEISKDQAKSLYGLPDKHFKFTSDDPLLVQAKGMFKAAKRILKLDGFHSTIVVLSGGTQPAIIQLRPEDRGEKYLLWERVAVQVEKTGANLIIAIAETWFAPFDPENPNRFAAESPDRAEGLHLAAANSKGEEYSLSAIFYRGPDGISFGDTVVEEKPNSNLLHKVRNVWLKRKTKKFASHAVKYKLGRNDKCLCRSGKKHKNCCLNNITADIRKKAQKLYEAGDYINAEIAYRAFLTQYLLWFHEHTQPAIRYDLEAADEILFMDINAISEIIFAIVLCMHFQNDNRDIIKYIDTVADIIKDDRYEKSIIKIRETYVSKIKALT